MNLGKLYIRLISVLEQRNGKPCLKYGVASNRREGFEIHHILPSSMGGTNEPANLVYVTPKEHFTLHHILARSYGGSLAIAFDYMTKATTSANGMKFTSRQFATAKELDRIARSERMKGVSTSHIFTEEVREKISKALTGRKRDPSISAKANATKLEKGIAYTDEQKEQARQRKNQINRERAEQKRKDRGALSYSEAAKIRASDPEYIEKVRNALKGIRVICPHCGKEGGAGMYRWHFDNCRLKGEFFSTGNHLLSTKDHDRMKK